MTQLKRKFKQLIAGTLVATMMIPCFTGCGKVQDAHRSIVVENANGSSVVLRGDDEMAAVANLALVSQDLVGVRDESSLELLLDADKHVLAEANTQFTIESTGSVDKGLIRIELAYGAALFTIDNKLSEESSFEVVTPNATMSVRGTIFRVFYDMEKKMTLLEVREGVVHVSDSNVADEIDVLAGENVKITTTEIEYIDIDIDTLHELDGSVSASEVPEGSDDMTGMQESATNESGMSSEGRWVFATSAGAYDWDENGLLLQYRDGRKLYVFQNDGKHLTSYTGYSTEPELEDGEFVDEGTFDSKGRLTHRRHGTYTIESYDITYKEDEQGRKTQMYITGTPEFECGVEKIEATYDFNYDDGNINLKSGATFYYPEGTFDSFNDVDYQPMYTYENGVLTKFNYMNQFTGYTWEIYDIEYLYNNKAPGEHPYAANVRIVLGGDGWGLEDRVLYDGQVDLWEDPIAGDVVYIPVYGDDFFYNYDMGSPMLMYIDDPSKIIVLENYPTLFTNW